MNSKTIAEFLTIKDFISNKYPSGIVSLVCDSFNFWEVLNKVIPALKEDILNRKPNALGLSKVVIRPDSGDPADIICGLKTKTVSGWYETNTLEQWKEAVAEDMDELFCKNLDPVDPHQSETETFKCPIDNKIYEVTYKPDLDRHDKTYYYVDNYGDTVSKCTFIEKEVTPEQKGSIELLWEVFGGTINEKGYKVLDSHIGLIYGDSITMPVALDVFKRLEAKGFASTNVVFGVGSYSLNYNTRDSLGIAVKATYAEVNGVGYELFKDPVTDSGVKKSAKGLLRVEKEGDDYVLHDQQSVTEEQNGELKTVFKDGNLVTETSLSEIRNRLWN